MVSAIVLAAGMSSRMGTENKLLLPLKNKTVIEAVVKTILDSGIKDVIVVTGHEAQHVQDVLKNLKIQFIHNPDYTKGMTTSIQHGVMAASGSGFMICLSDMIMITAAEYKFLESAFEERVLVDPMSICLPQYKNEKGNPVIFSAFYKETILQNQQLEGCKNIVQYNKQHLYMIEMDTPHVLQDLDYPDDYKKLLPVL